MFSERKKQYEFTFSDRNIQELVIEYTTKLYDYYTEYKLDNLDNEYTFKDLSQKEKDFIECTMRLDLTKLEDVVNSKIEWK